MLHFNYHINSHSLNALASLLLFAHEDPMARYTIFDNRDFRLSIADFCRAGIIAGLGGLLQGRANMAADGLMYHDHYYDHYDDD